MTLPPILATIANFVVIFPMAFTPILLVFGTRFLHRFSKLLNTKVLVTVIVIWIGFCVRQIFVGETKLYWVWMIPYLLFALIILLYTRKNKGYDNISSFRLAVYSIWGTAFLKELVWYIKYKWHEVLIGKLVTGRLFSVDWVIWGFHISCIISACVFFLILVQLGWRPSTMWIGVFVMLFLFEWLVFEPAWKIRAMPSSIGNFHRIPWFGLVLFAVIESPKVTEE